MLPTTPTIGGKGSNKLKSDMKDVGSGKKGKAKVVGSMKKNPGKSSMRKRA